MKVRLIGTYASFGRAPSGSFSSIVMMTESVTDEADPGADIEERTGTDIEEHTSTCELLIGLEVVHGVGD